MKTKITSLFGAVLSLLVTFGFSERAAEASGDRIVFNAPVTVKDTSTRGKATYTTTWQIFSMNSDGSGVMQLTSGIPSCLHPKWSPRQEYILFVRGDTLSVMNADGGGIFTVATVSPGGQWDWSPDGSKIVFGGSSTVGYGLWVEDVNADTGESGTPTLIRGGLCVGPAWSPDGTKIAFVDQSAGISSGAVTVLDLGSSSEFTFDRVPSAQPSWSPDGSFITFIGDTGPYTATKGHTTSINYYWGIFIAKGDGSEITQVTHLEAKTVYPSWSPSGTDLLFTSEISGTKSLYRMPLATGAVTLLRADAWEADWAP
jgi:TolB protein